jgi:hypothetical protein
MAEARECPLCGCTMRLRHTTSVVNVPAHPNPSTRTIAEWLCPDCDYFEEAEEETT